MILEFNDNGNLEVTEISPAERMLVGMSRSFELEGFEREMVVMFTTKELCESIPDCAPMAETKEEESESQPETKQSEPAELDRTYLFKQAEELGIEVYKGMRTKTLAAEIDKARANPPQTPVEAVSTQQIEPDKTVSRATAEQAVRAQISRIISLFPEDYCDKILPVFHKYNPQAENVSMLPVESLPAVAGKLAEVTV